MLSTLILGFQWVMQMVSQHNTDSKTFSNAFNNLTITGQSDEVGIKQEIDDYVEMVFAQEATAKAYVRKIYRYFVKSEWDQEVEDDIITPLSAAVDCI